MSEEFQEFDTTPTLTLEPFAAEEKQEVAAVAAPEEPAFDDRDRKSVV